jgi:hypothetical protein
VEVSLQITGGAAAVSGMTRDEAQHPTSGPFDDGLRAAASLNSTENEFPTIELVRLKQAASHSDTYRSYELELRITNTRPVPIVFLWTDPLKIDTWDEGRYSQSMRFYGMIPYGNPPAHVVALKPGESHRFTWRTFGMRTTSRAIVSEYAVAEDVSAAERSDLLALEGKTIYGRMYEWIGMNTYILPFACRVPTGGATTQPGGVESASAPSQPTTTNAAGHQAISQDDAIRIALQLLKSKDRLSRQYSVNAKLMDDQWRVTVERLPPRPGGHVTVVVGSDGDVKQVIPGM